MTKRISYQCHLSGLPVGFLQVLYSPPKVCERCVVVEQASYPQCDPITRSPPSCTDYSGNRKVSSPIQFQSGLLIAEVCVESITAQ